ncbi:hypothetical protein HDV00_005007 [Rhizophlyctis rosea]|nr:hypothetical protein HDV00_005007 [Rhizophlyctis rosea]
MSGQGAMLKSNGSDTLAAAVVVAMIPIEPAEREGLFALGPPGGFIGVDQNLIDCATAGVLPKWLGTEKETENERGKIDFAVRRKIRDLLGNTSG